MATLAKVPADGPALAGMASMASMARKYMGEGNLSAAAQVCENGLEIDPNYIDLKRLQVDIRRAADEPEPEPEPERERYIPEYERKREKRPASAASTDLGEVPRIIQLIGAVGLRRADTFGGADPYAVAFWNGEELGETAVERKTVSPTWNANFPILIGMDGGSLKVQIFDNDDDGDHDFLGEVELKLGVSALMSAHLQAPTSWHRSLRCCRAVTAVWWLLLVLGFAGPGRSAGGCPADTVQAECPQGLGRRGQSDDAPSRHSTLPLTSSRPECERDCCGSFFFRAAPYSVTHVGSWRCARQVKGNLKLQVEEEGVDMALKKLFREIDEDGSGFLDMAEVQLLSQRLGKRLNPKELELAMAEMDGDGSGEVDFPEFQLWWKAMAVEKKGFLTGLLGGLSTAGGFLGRLRGGTQAADVAQTASERRRKLVIVGAMGLLQADRFGKSDPYCIIHFDGVSTRPAKALPPSPMPDTPATCRHHRFPDERWSDSACIRFSAAPRRSADQWPCANPAGALWPDRSHSGVVQPVLLVFLLHTSSFTHHPSPPSHIVLLLLLLLLLARPPSKHLSFDGQRRLNTVPGFNAFTGSLHAAAANEALTAICTAVCSGRLGPNVGPRFHDRGAVGGRGAVD